MRQFEALGRPPRMFSSYMPGALFMARMNCAKPAARFEDLRCVEDPRMNLLQESVLKLTSVSISGRGAGRVNKVILPES